MNGTPMQTVARSVQLAVMATPSTTVDEAVAEARRRHAVASVEIDDRSAEGRRRPLMAAAA